MSSADQQPASSSGNTSNNNKSTTSDNKLPPPPSPPSSPSRVVRPPRPLQPLVITSTAHDSVSHMMMLGGEGQPHPLDEVLMVGASGGGDDDSAGGAGASMNAQTLNSTNNFQSRSLMSPGANALRVPSTASGRSVSPLPQRPAQRHTVGGFSSVSLRSVVSSPSLSRTRRNVTYDSYANSNVLPTSPSTLNDGANSTRFDGSSYQFQVPSQILLSGELEDTSYYANTNNQNNNNNNSSTTPNNILTRQNRSGSSGSMIMMLPTAAVAVQPQSTVADDVDSSMFPSQCASGAITPPKLPGDAQTGTAPPSPQSMSHQGSWRVQQPQSTSPQQQLLGNLQPPATTMNPLTPPPIGRSGSMQRLSSLTSGSLLMMTKNNNNNNNNHTTSGQELEGDQPLFEQQQEKEEDEDVTEEVQDFYESELLLTRLVFDNEHENASTMCPTDTNTMSPAMGSLTKYPSDENLPDVVVSSTSGGNDNNIISQPQQQQQSCSSPSSDSPRAQNPHQQSNNSNDNNSSAAGNNNEACSSSTTAATAQQQQSQLQPITTSTSASSGTFANASSGNLITNALIESLAKRAPRRGSWIEAIPRTSTSAVPSEEAQSASCAAPDRRYKVVDMEAEYHRYARHKASSYNNNNNNNSNNNAGGGMSINSTGGSSNNMSALMMPGGGTGAAGSGSGGGTAITQFQEQVQNAIDNADHAMLEVESQDTVTDHGGDTASDSHPGGGSFKGTEQNGRDSLGAASDVNAHGGHHHASSAFANFDEGNLPPAATSCETNQHHDQQQDEHEDEAQTQSDHHENRHHNTKISFAPTNDDDHHDEDDDDENGSRKRSSSNDNQQQHNTPMHLCHSFRSKHLPGVPEQADPTDDGDCGCSEEEIARFSSLHDVESIDFVQLLSRCTVCQRRPAAFIALHDLKACCPSHVQLLAEEKPEERTLFVNILDISTSYDRIFWCEKCKTFTWKYTDPYTSFIDRIVRTRRPYLTEPSTDVFVQHYQITDNGAAATWKPVVLSANSRRGSRSMTTHPLSRSMTTHPLAAINNTSLVVGPSGASSPSPSSPSSPLAGGGGTSSANSTQKLSTTTGGGGAAAAATTPKATTVCAGQPLQRLCVTLTSTQGWRSTQEDAEVVFRVTANSLSLPESVLSAAPATEYVVLCVFDGHGGDAVAKIAAHNVEHHFRFALHNEIIERRNSRQNEMTRTPSQICFVSNLESPAKDAAINAAANDNDNNNDMNNDGAEQELTYDHLRQQEGEDGGGGGVGGGGGGGGGIDDLPTQKQTPILTGASPAAVSAVAGSLAASGRGSGCGSGSGGGDDDDSSGGKLNRRPSSLSTTPTTGGSTTPNPDAQLSAEAKERRRFFEKVLKQTFLSLDKAIESTPEHLNDAYYGMVGCTACVVVITEEDIVCASAGDSRACLWNKHRRVAIPLSYDHKLSVASERARVIDAGYQIVNDRIEGFLAVPRALGDFDFKMNGSVPPEEQAVTACPDVRLVPRSSLRNNTNNNTNTAAATAASSDSSINNSQHHHHQHHHAGGPHTIISQATGQKFFTMANQPPEDWTVLLACDGVWDGLTNEEACTAADRAFDEEVQSAFTAHCRQAAGVSQASSFHSMLSQYSAFGVGGGGGAFGGAGGASGTAGGTNNAAAGMMTGVGGAGGGVTGSTDNVKSIISSGLEEGQTTSSGTSPIPPSAGSKDDESKSPSPPVRAVAAGSATKALRNLASSSSPDRHVTNNNSSEEHQNPDDTNTSSQTQQQLDPPSSTNTTTTIKTAQPPSSSSSFGISGNPNHHVNPQSAIPTQSHHQHHLHHSHGEFPPCWFSAALHSNAINDVLGDAACTVLREAIAKEPAEDTGVGMDNMSLIVARLCTTG